MPNRPPQLTPVPWHRNPTVRAFVTQFLLVALTLFVLTLIYRNTAENLAERGIKTGLQFMDTIAPFSIPLNFSPFWDFTLGKSQYWEVLIIGIQNTILVSLLGIPAATLIGLIVGIARLSPNWLLSKFAGFYVEIFRNTPLLLQLMFWAFGVFPLLLQQLPSARASLIYFGGGVVINNTGINLPAPIFDGIGLTIIALCLGLGLVACWQLIRWARRRQVQTGQVFSLLFPTIVALMVGVLVLGFALSTNHYELEIPVRRGLNYSGGLRPPVQLLILWFGLTVYTAAFIAENVRAGILAVSRGQSEAAMACGLRRLARLRLVILPQALRVIIPPTISQFLNLIKNSSLAVAIGYPELTNIWAGIALNQTGQSLVIIMITILVYEVLSLSISAILNWYNKRIQLTER